MEATQAVEAIVRTSYGRLVAFLAARSRDVAAAEDALSEALHAALSTWPTAGIPAKPEAWLLAVARRKLIDERRRGDVRGAAEPALVVALEAARDAGAAPGEFPDERLKLLFICAHPAIDDAMRTPLMLQTVLGVEAGRIAAAFLTAPAAMGQRLVRAKAKIRDAGIAWEVPERHELPARLEAVLAAIYAAYGTGWEDAVGGETKARGLAAEALRLARVVVELLPEEPEARGLLALILYCEARRAARRGPDGEFVPLAEQDTQRWSRELVAEAEKTLSEASRRRSPGRFQLEAAIQSAHTQRRFTGTTNWAIIARLHAALVQWAPTVGAQVSHAAALAEAGEAAAALAVLEAVPQAAAENYQPWHATHAHVLGKLGRANEARESYARAIGLSEDAAVRDFLAKRREAISFPGTP